MGRIKIALEEETQGYVKEVSEKELKDAVNSLLDENTTEVIIRKRAVQDDSFSKKQRQNI